jgi:CrcB protein
VLAAIFAGGALGTLGRYEVGLAWPSRQGRFPGATFTVNTTGAFLIGLVLVAILERFPPSRHARPFLVVGGLGGWTTMSTLATEAVLLIKGGRWTVAVGYVVASLAAGVVATAAGMTLGRLPRRTRKREASAAA